MASRNGYTNIINLLLKNGMQKKGKRKVMKI
jgi:hypothetical protein